MVAGAAPAIRELFFPRRALIGPGASLRTGEAVAEFGRRPLVVTGGRSLERSGALARILEGLKRAGATPVRVTVAREPDARSVDDATDRARAAGCDSVLAIGGGSALDLGKAVAGLASNEGTILDYLEGVGKGAVMAAPPLPLICAPTTAGTGSEATKNAVIGGTAGAGKFKKSFRDPRLVPLVAIVDPDLSAGCPPDVTAFAGLDAVTQLLESLTSTRSDETMSALALEGLKAAGSALPRLAGRGEDSAARAEMAYAAFLSGVTLSHAGLGVVHGLASPLGARLAAPHGAICARLLSPATAMNLHALRGGRGNPAALAAYARGEEALGASVERFCALLPVPGLSAFGMTADDIPPVLDGATGGSLGTNPVSLTREELAAILELAL